MILRTYSNIILTLFHIPSKLSRDFEIKHTLTCEL